MSGPSEREFLATFCRDTPHLRRELPESRRRLLESGLASLRSGTTSLVEVCRSIGYPTAGSQRGEESQNQNPGYAPLPGGLAGLPPGSYVCPATACSRVEPRDSEGVVPECAVYDRRLRRGADH
ncbi:MULTISPECIES: hypothetical protein [Micromonospora]|uniref:hypothetical protein n=1 Tax=Micromonospora TaxID=1873 RepID=UPI000A8B4C99|nr:hypothetical protein [Micromonospora haikouensis]